MGSIWINTLSIEMVATQIVIWGSNHSNSPTLRVLGLQNMSGLVPAIFYFVGRVGFLTLDLFSLS